MAIITPKMTLRPLNSDEMTAVREEAEKWRSYCNYDMAYPLLARLAKAGDDDARYACAELMHYGAGTEENKNAAFLLFSGLTADRFPHVLFYLGLYYENGWAVQQNYKKAFRYFTAGAEAGDPLCLTQLGTMYGKGNFVKKDPMKAFEYYRRASEDGDVLGTSNMAWCYANGEGVEKDLEKALELYEDAAAQREEHALDELAHFEEYYGRPDGVKRYNRLDIKIYDAREAEKIWDLENFWGRVADISIDGQRLIDLILREEAPYREKEGRNYSKYTLVKAGSLYDDLMEATKEGTYSNEFGVYACCCPCGESGCFDVSFFVTETDDSVIWHTFHHEHRSWPYHLRFRFRKGQYARQLRRLKNAERRPTDELPDLPKRSDYSDEGQVEE